MRFNDDDGDYNEQQILEVKNNQMDTTGQTWKELLTVKCTEPQYEYPMWCKNTKSGLVMKFTGLHKGTVVFTTGGSAIGQYLTSCVAHTDPIWEDVTDQYKKYDLDEILTDDLEFDLIDKEYTVDEILEQRGKKYGKFEYQAKCVGAIVKNLCNLGILNNNPPTDEMIGSFAYMSIKLARYANGEKGDTLIDLEGYAKLIKEMESKSVV